MAKSIRGPIEAPSNTADAIRRETLFCCKIYKTKAKGEYMQKEIPSSYTNEERLLPLHKEGWKGAK